jgi:hypothetical protein
MAKGLAEEDFYSSFRQCNACENIMAQRSVENHICPGHAAKGHGLYSYDFRTMISLFTSLIARNPDGECHKYE